VECEENRELLKKLGVVVFVDRPLEDIAVSVRYRADRPLLTDKGALIEMYGRRKPIYEKIADVTVVNDGPYSEISERITMLASLRLGVFDFAVIGDPVTQSLSPALHGAVYEMLGMQITYGAIKVAKEDLRLCVSSLRTGALRGLNVTIPHKIDIVHLLDELRGAALESGAVNTVVKDGGRLIGYNTDMEGLRLALEEKGFTYKGGKVVVIGAGGAAMGVIREAAAHGARQVVVSARSVKKAESSISAAMKPSSCDITIVKGLSAGLSPHLPDTDILINATPMGMEGRNEKFEDLSFLKMLPGKALVCDLVYKPMETELLKAAKGLGLPFMNGLSMLIFQGILAEEIFLDRKIDRGQCYKALMDILGGRRR